MVHLWIGVPMVDLQDLMRGSSPSSPGSALSLAFINTKSMVWVLCNVMHWLIQTLAMFNMSPSTQQQQQQHIAIEPST